MPLIIQIPTTPFHILCRLSDDEDDDEAKNNFNTKGDGEGQERNSVG